MCRETGGVGEGGCGLRLVLLSDHLREQRREGPHRSLLSPQGFQLARLCFSLQGALLGLASLLPCILPFC